MELERRGVQWARMLERQHLRDKLRALVLPGLERLADADADATELIALADRQARRLRTELRSAASSSEHRRSATSGLYAPALAAREEERAWVRGHLHDTALQILEFIAGDGFGTGLAADKIAALAGGAARDLRRWLDMPIGTCQAELVPELRQVAGEARKLGREDVELVLGRIESPPTGEQASAIAGAVREALTNARKHAQASRVIVHVEARGGTASVTVTDDGVGIDKARIGRGLGLGGSIVGRMKRVGGEAVIQRVPGGGTRIELTTTAPQEA